jgi:hypothetical protein
MIRIFLEELNLYLIFELMSSNREPVHIIYDRNFEKHFFFNSRYMIGILQNIFFFYWLSYHTKCPLGKCYRILYILKDLIYTYIMIRIFLEELNLYLIFELMSSNREPVHIDWQTNKNYGASETYLSIIILNVLWENAIGYYTYVLPYLNTGLLNMS